MTDRHAIPRHLDDPELIGFWTIDEFAGIIVPFTWGILAQHILIGIGLAVGAWFALRKAKAGRSAYGQPVKSHQELASFYSSNLRELKNQLGA